MTVLIFGISGQDGYYMHELCKIEGLNVKGVSRSNGDWIRGNISDYSFVSNLIKTFKPEYIFDFAANSSTSHEVLFENHQSISSGALNILEAVKLYTPGTKVFLSGSALQFENRNVPIKETDPFTASSSYAVERIYSTYLSRYYRSLGLKVYVGYFFHHDSPMRPEKHLNMYVIKTALKIKKSGKGVLEIGNPDIVKEFNYAGDIVQAVWKLVNQDKVFEAVIGSGKGYSVKEWVNICFDSIGLEINEHLEVTGNFKNEFKKLISDPSTIFSLGWEPEYDIHDLAKLMIDFEKGKVHV